MTPCDECKGKGTIALFTSVEECRACKGTGTADWLQEDHEDEWPTVPMFPVDPGLADYPPIRCVVGIAKDTGEAGDMIPVVVRPHVVKLADGQELPAGAPVFQRPDGLHVVGLPEDPWHTRRKYDPRTGAYTEEAGENLVDHPSDLTRWRAHYTPDLGPVPPSTEVQAKAAALAVPGVRRVVVDALGSAVFIRFWGGDTREVMAAVEEVRPAGVGFYLVDEGRMP